VKRSRTARLSAGVGPGLIKAACGKTDLNNDSELVNAGLLCLPHQMILERGPQPNLDACQRILSLKSVTFNRSLQAMIPVVGLDLWRTGQNRIFLFVHCRFLPGYLSCCTPRSIFISFGRQLPTSIINLMASRTILLGASPLAEIAVTIDALDPADRRTENRSPLENW
jgi:hypothetical protein